MSAGTYEGKALAKALTRVTEAGPEPAANDVAVTEQAHILRVQLLGLKECPSQPACELCQLQVDHFIKWLDANYVSTSHAALQAECARFQWQDIATAPKDGTEFLACWPQQGHVVQLISWNRIHGYWQSKGQPKVSMHAKLWMPIRDPRQALCAQPVEGGSDA